MVRWDSEICDDANNDPSDECGDGVTHVGLEGCDDANAIDGEGCDRNCTLTGCGNGRLTRGEFCDDGNTADGDYCSADCSSFSDGCGDADASGEVTASDAQRVVSSAVGLTSGCPRWACDVNGNGQVTAVDGSVVLRNSVGLQTEMRCRDRVIVRLASSILFGALQLRIDYSQTPGSFFDSAGPLRCTRLVPTLSAFSDVDGVLTLGFVSLTGVQGPVDLAECIFRRFAPPTADDFSVIIDDVSTPDFEAPEGPVEIELIVD